MKKEEYMGALQSALTGFDEELVQEIVSDYEERFRIGSEAGKTEEQIIAELGSIKDLVDELGEMQQGGGTESGTYFQEKSFSETFDFAMKKFGKVFDTVMREAGKAIENAAEQMEYHFEEAKKNHYYTYNGDDSFTYEGREKDMEGEPNVEQSGRGDVGCRKVVMDADFADVAVQTTMEAEPRAVCHYYSHKTAMLYPFYAKQEGDTFYVGVHRNRDTENKSGFFRFGMSPSVEIELFLPKGIDFTEIGSSSGDVELNGVSAKELVLHTKSGDIDVNHLTCDFISMKTASGDADIKCVQAAKAEIRTASGDAEINDCHGELLEAGSASGDIDIRAEYKTYLVQSQSGDVSLENRHDADVTVKSSSGDVEICMAETLETYAVTVHSVSGETIITGKNGSDSLYPTKKIEAKTISGDIEVRFL